MKKPLNVETEKNKSHGMRDWGRKSKKLRQGRLSRDGVNR